MTVVDAILSRRSTRAFTTDPVATDLVEHILETASRSPSNSNVQPWRVYALTGKTLQSFCDRACEIHKTLIDNKDLAQQLRARHDAHPVEWPSPYRERRQENGWGLYNLLGIAREDRDQQHQQQQKNYKFYGAPVGLLFTIDQRLSRRFWADHGMFLQNIALLAQESGLDTCLIGAWTALANFVLDEIQADSNELLVCGMAVGYADQSALVNSFQTTRAPLEEFFKWI
jgi:nitroreductase